MKNRTLRLVPKLISLFCFLLLVMIFSSCSEDPKPVNEEELITTLIADLTPVGGGDVIELKFYDEDGDGIIPPIITPSLAQFTSGKAYEAVLTLKNESETPAGDVTLEIVAEKNDHLFCYSVTGTDVTIAYNDEDDNAKRIGLNTIWTTGVAGNEGTVKITLRHQPDLKTGDCPGAGDTDIEVTFNVQIIN